MNNCLHALRVFALVVLIAGSSFAQQQNHTGTPAKKQDTRTDSQKSYVPSRTTDPQRKAGNTTAKPAVVHKGSTQTKSEQKQTLKNK